MAEPPSVQKHQRRLQEAISVATARNANDTDVGEVNNLFETTFSLMADYTPAISPNTNSGVIPMPVAAGIRDASLASVRLEQQTSTITHHSLQQRTLQQCAADIARTADAVRGQPTIASEKGGPISISKKSFAHRFGMPASSSSSSTTAVDVVAELTSRNDMDPTVRKIFNGVAWGHGAAAPQPNIRPSLADAQQEDPMATAAASEALGLHSYMKSARGVPLMPRSSSKKDTSVVVHETARHSFLSKEDPLIALASRPVNLEPTLANVTSNLPGAPSYQSATEKSLATTAASGDAVLQAACADATVISATGLPAGSGRGVADKTSAIAAVLEPSRKTGRKRKRFDHTAMDDNDVNHPLSSTKISVDAELLQNPETDLLVRKMCRAKYADQIQPEDNRQLFAPLKSVIGTASLASKMPPIYPGLRPSQSSSSSSSTDTVAGLIQRTANVVRIELGNWGISGQSDSFGISLEDSKQIARSEHSDIPPGKFVNRMRGLVADLAAYDTIYQLNVLDQDIAQELRERNIVGRGTIDEGSIDYRFVDISSKAATRAFAKGTEIPLTAAQMEAKQAERGAVFASFKRMEDRLKREGRCCYSLRGIPPSGEQARQRPKMETISRRYIKSYLVKPTPEDIREKGLRLCKNGADCVCNIIPNAHYAKLYTSQTERATSAAAAASNMAFSSTTTSSASSSLSAAAVAGGVSSSANEISSGKQPFARRAKTAHLVMSATGSVAAGQNAKRLFVSNGVSRDAESFINVEFLTPDEEHEFEEWWQAIGKNASPEVRQRTDPRANLPQLCYVCYVRDVSIRHNAHISQQMPDGAQNTDPRTRDFLPLNRFQVLYDRLGEYSADSLIKTTTGAGVAGSSRLGNGRSLVIGSFPDFHLCNYEVLTTECTSRTGAIVHRPVIAEVGMDFRLSSAK